MIFAEQPPSSENQVEESTKDVSWQVFFFCILLNLQLYHAIVKVENEQTWSKKRKNKRISIQKYLLKLNASEEGIYELNAHQRRFTLLFCTGIRGCPRWLRGNCKSGECRGKNGHGGDGRQRWLTHERGWVGLIVFASKLVHFRLPRRVGSYFWENQKCLNY